MYVLLGTTGEMNAALEKEALLISGLFLVLK